MPSGGAYRCVLRLSPKITEAEIEWLATQVNAAFDAQKRIDMLIIVRTYEGQELGDIFDTEAFSAQLRSARQVSRYTVVRAPAWASTR